MPTRFTFTKIVVADLDSVIPFYRDAIGLRMLTRLTAPDGDYAQEEAVFAGPGGERGPMLLLVRYLNLAAPVAGSAWTGFSVDDLDATLAAVEAGGGKIVIPRHDVPVHGLTVAVAADPEGHLIELTTPLT
ncbi:putative enzyme related to lactoylglutathione lyase [Sphingobium sp. OAS761]|uniref:VOC family protein n=1 Tax=Sphingobium sp. OAS761 TaxID=2817901 RepID=UPI00209CFB54|nr:VOC family protein [Sphingobium sp. OAS761]MCP1470424.1 putative enzyme related to lactoylglutathione lyase [Sphingobium sp. OAS761]